MTDISLSRYSYFISHRFHKQLHVMPPRLFKILDNVKRVIKVKIVFYKIQKYSYFVFSKMHFVSL